MGFTGVSTLTNALARVDLISLAVAVPLVLILGLIVPYFVDPHCIRNNGITGPLSARFSDAWLGWVAAQGHRSEVVHEMHKKYGTFVRLAPNHVSISDPAALQIVYAHGNGTLKSSFYDAFVSIRRGLFNTRSRPEHTRKRKIVSHIFSQKSVLEFEPHIRLHVGELFTQWDKLCDGGKRGLKGTEGDGWEGHDGWVWFDCLPWFNYLAFDIIGDLAFGSPFGMILKGKDAAPVAKDQKAAIAGYGRESASEKSACDVTELPAVQVLNDRGEYSASMGVLPPWWRPFVRRIPWYANGNRAVKNLAGLAVAAVAKRLANPTDRTDLLSKLQEGKDDEGRPMGREELTAEALTQLIAGSDTTSNSSCAITYHLAHNPHVLKRLQQELDTALAGEDDPVATFQQVKSLPYLDAVINEVLRIHSTSGIGLPRLVPEGGLTVCGKTFPEGTVLSVPTYTIHRDKEVWGEDVEAMRPERWLEGDQAAIQKTFNPFSFGPRACVGRNLASMELLIIIASIFRRYEFVLEKPDEQFDTREGFLRKPLRCRVGMRRREL
ncbi:cytochrome P450 monooxygenase pc-bph [Fomitiporia mediterranea MF3/22]|uniref:cytochrome P450 monooxygenase pc-bph n=1 Tax=Fomitiporia mediterranea (strain MF3/22) TaxID=694068 RepID=UPI00044073DC|nr:cytochrome P450 monooxygenase pc-bph [Fomitiporia mediterranea MF3/22]EJC99221.1 cytochrome P450 monooxygenase pc-bph [Fomitiporia mediterranea MF3/22]